VKVFVAGASGALGRSLVPRLVAAHHDVTGTTRSRQRAEAIRAAGASPAVVDALDAQALREAVERAAPEVVVHERELGWQPRWSSWREGFREAPR
jgi:nucleoside-diphosphate-sugar epimerase